MKLTRHFFIIFTQEGNTCVLLLRSTVFIFSLSWLKQKDLTMLKIFYLKKAWIHCFKKITQPLIQQKWQWKLWGSNFVVDLILAHQTSSCEDNVKNVRQQATKSTGNYLVSAGNTKTVNGKLYANIVECMYVYVTAKVYFFMKVNNYLYTHNFIKYTRKNWFMISLVNTYHQWNYIVTASMFEPKVNPSKLTKSFLIVIRSSLIWFICLG